MTNDELKKAAAVMLAAAEGKQIQYRQGKDWVTAKDNTKLAFNWWEYKYRIKPNTIKYRLALCNFESGNDDGTWSTKTRVVSFEDEETFQTWNRLYGDNFIRFLTDWIEVEINDETV